jgi:PilZ domain-containing protein
MTSQRARRGRYYTVIAPKLIRAAIFPKDPRQTECYFAELKEISKTGAKLLVTGLPALQRECRISLASPKFQGVLVIPAEVHWVRPNPAGDWMLGCGIDPPLSDESFQALVDSGLLARRSVPREPARIPVQVQWQPGAPPLPAVVRDISTGGLCVTTRQAPVTTNHACLLASEPGSEIRIPVKVRWSRQAGLDYFVGCQFIQPSDFAVLLKLQPVARNHFHEPARAHDIHAF